MIHRALCKWKQNQLTHTKPKKNHSITAPKLEVEVSRVWHCYSWHCLQPQTFSCSCLPSAWWGLWMDNNSDTGGQDSSLLQLFLSSSTVCHSIGNVGSDIPLLPVVKYYIYFVCVWKGASGGGVWYPLWYFKLYFIIKFLPTLLNFSWN